jgi:DNA-binding NarL/FixJ family response regulator
MVVRARVLSGRVARLPPVPGWDPCADRAPARPRRERPQSVAEASRLRNEGLLLREIGAELGVSAKTVHAWLSDP